MSDNIFEARQYLDKIGYRFSRNIFIPLAKENKGHLKIYGHQGIAVCTFPHISVLKVVISHVTLSHATFETLAVVRGEPCVSQEIFDYSMPKLQKNWNYLSLMLIFCLFDV